MAAVTSVLKGAQQFGFKISILYCYEEIWISLRSTLRWYILAHNSQKLFGYMEGLWHHFSKHARLFAYNLRIERDVVLKLTWLSAHSQHL